MKKSIKQIENNELVKRFNKTLDQNNLNAYNYFKSLKTKSSQKKINEDLSEEN